MKPLNEFAEDLRGMGAHVHALALAEKNVTLSTDNTSTSKAFYDGMGRAADLLQAWLREADAEVAFEFFGSHKSEHVPAPVIRAARWFRQRLLGTTRQGDGR